jgi:hypothetical protein
MAGGTRLLPLEGTFNFRDLGGYPTVDGRQTGWGRLFRSDALQELTAVDRAFLRDAVGLSTVVDLRAPGEADRVGVWPSAPEQANGLGYVNLPVIPPGSGDDPTVPTASRDGRAERYLWYLDVGGPAVTGAAHWQVLVRARAIENQCYVIACNRSGADPKNAFAGHSMIIDPWGEVLAEAGEREEIITAEIDLAKVEEVRKRIPIFEDRRPQYY